MNTWDLKTFATSSARLYRDSSIYLSFGVIVWLVESYVYVVLFNLQWLRKLHCANKSTAYNCSRMHDSLIANLLQLL